MPSSANLGLILEKYVDELVATGRYGSRSEVLREGVRLVQEREKRLAVLDAALKRGAAQANASRGADAEGLFDRLIAKHSKPARPARGK